MRSKNRFFKSVLCLLAVVFCVVGLAACELYTECVHDWSEWSTTKAATCMETGVQERKCSICEEVESKTVAVSGHLPNADDGDCTTAITCSVCGKETTAASGGHDDEVVWVKRTYTHYSRYVCCYVAASEPAAHTIVDGVCTECGFNPTVTATSLEAAPGDQISIAVSIKDNPGITGLMVTVQYSPDMFTLTEAKGGEALDALMFTAPSSLDSGCKFLWDGVDVQDADVKDGEFLALTFDVAENAPAGEYSILLKISAYDNELNQLTLIISGGKVTIKNN